MLVGGALILSNRAELKLSNRAEFKYNCIRIGRAALNDHIFMLVALVGATIATIAQIVIASGEEFPDSISVATEILCVVFNIFQFFLIISLCQMDKNQKKKIFQDDTNNRLIHAMLMMHIFVIMHDFLFESHHLEEIVENEHSAGVSDKIEFTLFFTGIEFHLACIERIKFIN